jgi:hypothetical protein
MHANNAVKILTFRKDLIQNRMHSIHMISYFLEYNTLGQVKKQVFRALTPGRSLFFYLFTSTNDRLLFRVLELVIQY